MTKLRSPATHRPIVILCADDYAFAPGISSAIRDLVAAGRLSATSCMTASPSWPAEAKALETVRNRADIGLHLTFTDLPPLGPMPRLCPHGQSPPLGRLIGLAMARRLESGEITAEIERQFDAFEQALGMPPAFIDGHHHVHQLPGIGDSVLAVLARRGLAGPPFWTRYCDEPLGHILARGHVGRAAIISRLGRGFVARARAGGLPGNQGFRGVHDFSGRQPYADLFASFLRPVRHGMLVMCHPGYDDAALAAVDGTVSTRREEYAFLAGEGLPAALAAAGVRLGRVAETIK